MYRIIELMEQVARGEIEEKREVVKYACEKCERLFNSSSSLTKHLNKNICKEEKRITWEEACEEELKLESEIYKNSPLPIEKNSIVIDFRDIRDFIQATA